MPFKTDYRGTLYIHSSGRFSYTGMPDFSGLPVPVIHEFNQQMTAIEELTRKSRYIDIPDRGVRIVLKDEDSQDRRVIREYNFLAQVYAFYRKYPSEPYFRSQAIVGKVELADISHTSASPWAKDEHFHWILRSPKIFDRSITGLKESAREGIWTYESHELNE